MTNPNELVLKYLKKIKARVLPDGSPHPDDLSEAKSLATVELLENGEIEPPEDCTPLSDSEALQSWLEMAKNFGDIESVASYILHAVHKHERQVQKVPDNPPRLPEAGSLKKELDELLGSGLKKPSAIQTLADKYSVAPDSVRKCLSRAGYKAKK